MLCDERGGIGLGKRESECGCLYVVSYCFQSHTKIQSNGASVTSQAAQTDTYDERPT